MAIEICDQPECSEPATHAYTWEWGASGVVCAKHQVVLAQTAQNLGRTIQFGPLNANATAPLQREERVKLRAEALVLAEELAEAKTHGLELYRQNTLLTAQVQSLTVRSREAEAQRQDAVTSRDEMDRRLAALETENANLTDEVQRLRVLVEIPPLKGEGGSGAFDPKTSPGVGPFGSGGSGAAL